MVLQPSLFIHLLTGKGIRILYLPRAVQQTTPSIVTITRRNRPTLIGQQPRTTQAIITIIMVTVLRGLLAYQVIAVVVVALVVGCAFQYHLCVVTIAVYGKVGGYTVTGFTGTNTIGVIGIGCCQPTFNCLHHFVLAVVRIAGGNAAIFRFR